MKHTIKKLPKSQVEIEIEVPSEELEDFISHAKEHLAEHLKIDGFRPGNVPKEMVEGKVGMEQILAEAADMAVNHSYKKVVTENNLEPIAHPEVKVLKLAQGNPFIFKITVNVLPEVELGDYKKIASKSIIKEVSATEEEIKDSLEYIKKSRAKYSQLERPAQEKDFVEIEYESPELGTMSVLKDGKGSNKTRDQFILSGGGFMPGFEQNIIGMKNNEEKEFSIIFPQAAQRKDLAGKEVHFKVRVISVQKVELPEINDEFAKTLGKFENVAGLMVSVKEGIKMEKEEQEKQIRRNEILEKISEKSKFDLPQSLIDMEKENLFKNFQNKITQNYKLTFDQYLASVKQDEATLKESFAKEAEKKVKNYLVLKEIGKKENVSVTSEEIEKQVNLTLGNYPKEMLAKIDIGELKEYTKGVIFNEKVFQKLESFIEKK